MYIPSHFAEADAASIRAIIEQFPLASVVYSANGRLEMHQIPLIFARDNQLIGHIALQNNLHQLVAGDEVLIVFHAQDSYISPNWYPSKFEHHQRVPTWNYQMVQVRGTVTFSHDNKTKLAVVGKMTKHFEQALNGDQQWKLADLEQATLVRMLENIVALRVDITQIEAKSKLGQDKEPKDFYSVLEQVEQRGLSFMAQQMRAKGAP